MDNMAKQKFNANEAACLILSHKLFSDYIEASSVICDIELEHFAEDWLAQNLGSSIDDAMSMSIWRHFLEKLFEYRKDRPDGD
jgi:hypothetical protein